MISPDAFWGIVVMVAITLLGGIYGYGRLSQKVDSANKSIEKLDKKLDTFACAEHSGMCAKVEGVEKDLDIHMRHHRWDGKDRRSE